MSAMKKIGLSSSALHIIAMACMLCDHLWLALIPDNDWMTVVGRLAFPIFAFLTVEGFYHTHSLKRYIIRLAALAVISEIPFNLLASGEVFYPLHQNVIWTLLLGLIGIALMERAKNKGKPALTVIIDAAVIIAGFILGFVLFTDYFGVGVLTVFVFYFFREKRWWSYLGQAVFLIILNAVILKGRQIGFTLFGAEMLIPLQAFAVLALIPIWLYNGAQGKTSKTFRYLCYAFYPIHMLVLYLLSCLIAY